MATLEGFKKWFKKNKKSFRKKIREAKMKPGTSLKKFLPRHYKPLTAEIRTWLISQGEGTGDL